MASIQKRGSRWLARYRDDAGREHHQRFDRKLDAQRWLNTITASQVRGDYVDPGRSRVTVGEWADRWLAAQVQLTPSTRARYEAALRHQVLPRWQSVPLAKVTHADVTTWVAELGASGLTPWSVRKAHRVLSRVLDLAVRDRRIPSNPAAGVGLPRIREADKRFLSDAEVDELAAACGEHAVLIYTLAYCGLRFGELAALRVRDVDPMRRRITVRESVTDVNGRMVFGEPKSHQRREVPVPRFLADRLGHQLAGKAGDELVFTGREGGVLRNNNFRRRTFDRAAASVGLDGLTPHELRHTAASLAVASGANVKAVQRVLGHQSAAMTLDVYAGLFGDDLDAVADRMDAARERHADTVRTAADVSTLDEHRASG